MAVPKGKQGAQSYTARRLPPQAPAPRDYSKTQVCSAPRWGHCNARLPGSVSFNPLIKGVTRPSQISIPTKYQAGPLRERREREVTGGGVPWGPLPSG